MKLRRGEVAFRLERTADVEERVSDVARLPMFFVLAEELLVVLDGPVVLRHVRVGINVGDVGERIESPLLIPELRAETIRVLQIRAWVSAQNSIATSFWKVT